MATEIDNHFLLFDFLLEASVKNCSIGRLDAVAFFVATLLGALAGFDFSFLDANDELAFFVLDALGGFDFSFEMLLPLGCFLLNETQDLA